MIAGGLAIFRKSAWEKKVHLTRKEAGDMSEFGWKEIYSVGVEEIDQQHKDFLKLINRLNILQGKGDPPLLISRYLRELGAYAAYHFASEENTGLEKKNLL